MARVFASLAEFDAYVAGDDDRAQDALVADLSNSFLHNPQLLDVPKDPFSAEYREAILRIHASVSDYDSYDAREMEWWPVDIDEEVRRPAAYRNTGAWLANYLESFSHVIRRLEVEPGMRVIDLGCGDAEIVLHLARLGCDVTAVDLHPDQVRIVEQKAANLGVSIDAVCATFDDAPTLGVFDRVLFYQAFHHSLEHQRLVEHFDAMLAPGGRVVFGAEPVIDPDGPWKMAVPYPWGPRLDGLSLRQMRKYGWMELGFQTPYFRELLDRSGWSFDAFTSDANGLASSIVSQRKSELPPAAPSTPPSEGQSSQGDVEPQSQLDADSDLSTTSPADAGVVRVLRRASRRYTQNRDRRRSC